MVKIGMKIKGIHKPKTIAMVLLARAITIRGKILNKCLNFLSLRLYLYIKKIPSG